MPSTPSPSSQRGSPPPHRLTQVAPGVRVVPLRSPTLPPAAHTNAWVLGDREVVVVDPASPWPEPRRALLEALRGLTVQAVFLTHHHHDHIGGVEHLVRNSRAATADADAGHLRRGPAAVLAHPHTAAQVDLHVDQLLDDGATLDTDHGSWTLIHTPGHARGHLCLHRQTDGLVVAGDMVAGEGTIVLDPPEGHLGDYLDSLHRLIALGPSRLLPAHGPPIDDGAALLRHYVTHRHQRTDQVRDALARHAPARPLDLVPDIYPDVPPLFHPLAARQVLCHLQWLRDQGEATALDAGPGGADDRWRPTTQEAG